MNRLIGASALIGLLALGACGGSGNGPATSETRLDLDYSSAAGERHSYTPYATRSHVYFVRRSDDATLVYIGGDLEPRETLRHVATQNGIRYFMGESRDGVGVDRLKNYEQDLITSNGTDPYGLSGNDFVPFAVQPLLYLDSDFLAPQNAGIREALWDSIQVLNDALPPEFQIVLAGTFHTDTALAGEKFDLSANVLIGGSDISANESIASGFISVTLESSHSIRAICGAGAVACAVNNINRIWGYTTSATLYIPDDFDVSEYMYPRKVIVHELLHALGIQGHVDSIEFPDSIMGTSGEYIPNLGFVISKIDREVLQIMYMSQRTGLYNDWGEWSDTSFHLMGESEDGALRFGVALFNGLPQPWARGVSPDTALADNSRLSGTATWYGTLLGFSGSSPIAGDAELEVSLSTVANDENEQDLRFRDIYFINRFESDSEDRWFHARDIDYKVAVTGNWFVNVGDDGYAQGHLFGAFFGANHEHMGGTVKRTDMVAAFGGSR